MNIVLTPEDVIRRCLWTEYKKFILKDKPEKEIEEIIQKNQPFSLTEEDAYVIGLIKIVETINLVHRFKLHMNEILDVKSTIQDVPIDEINKEKKVLINKSVMLNECITFKDRFPHYYNKDTDFNKAVEEVNEFINQKYQEIDKLETVTLTKIMNGQTKKVTYLFSNKVNRLFKM